MGMPLGIIKYEASKEMTMGIIKYTTVPLFVSFLGFVCLSMSLFITNYSFWTEYKIYIFRKECLWIQWWLWACAFDTETLVPDPEPECRKVASRVCTLWDSRRERYCCRYGFWWNRRKCKEWGYRTVKFCCAYRTTYRLVCD